MVRSQTSKAHSSTLHLLINIIKCKLSICNEGFSSTCLATLLPLALKENKLQLKQHTEKFEVGGGCVQIATIWMVM